MGGVVVVGEEKYIGSLTLPHTLSLSHTHPHTLLHTLTGENMGVVVVGEEKYIGPHTHTHTHTHARARKHTHT